MSTQVKLKHFKMKKNHSVRQNRDKSGKIGNLYDPSRKCAGWCDDWHPQDVINFGQSLVDDMASIDLFLKHSVSPKRAFKFLEEYSVPFFCLTTTLVANSQIGLDIVLGPETKCAERKDGSVVAVFSGRLMLRVHLMIRAMMLVDEFELAGVFARFCLSMKCASRERFRRYPSPWDLWKDTRSLLVLIERNLTIFNLTEECDLSVTGGQILPDLGPDLNLIVEGAYREICGGAGLRHSCQRGGAK